MYKSLIFVMFSICSFSFEPPRSATVVAPNIDGTYLLVRRVTADGKELKSPAIEGLYTLSHGHGNLNIFWKKEDGKLASESTILRYQLTAGKYCEWILYTVRNEIDGPGVSTEAPKVTDHCTSIEVGEGKVVFSPPGEGVTTSFDENGFTATVNKELADTWIKLR